jgi:hypothetical protein
MRELIYPDVLIASAVSEEGEDIEALPLDSLDFVKLHIPLVNDSRDAIIKEMESMVSAGLNTLVCFSLSSFRLMSNHSRINPCCRARCKRRIILNCFQT